MGKTHSKLPSQLQSELIINDDRSKFFNEFELTYELEANDNLGIKTAFENDLSEVSADYIELKNRFENYWRNNKPKGESIPSGVQIGDKGRHYGEWVKGLKNGHGIFKYVDGAVLEGYWSQNKLIGSALLVKSETVYFGPLIKGKAEGLGVKRFNGIETEGFWHLGKLEGEGKEIRPDGSTFIGLYSKGCKSGKGVLSTPRFRFSGEFKDNIFNGFGEFQSTDGCSYRGDWRQGYPHGSGIYRYASGCVFKGEFTYGKRSGFGEFVWPNGSRYCGEFLDNVLHGAGKYFYPDGSYFEGFWHQGNKKGLGKLIKSNGKVIQGIWHDGVFQSI